MGIPKQDPEYLRAKYAFIRDLIQFHESRGTGLHCDPKINGKEVDLYLLYQIVTSHGGWEKINLRNEWDKLLEHFHLPRSTNGGIAIKQIYLRYLELYEKIHFLGEDIDAKEDHEDEYEDFRGRRRYPNSLSSRHSSHHHHHHHHSSSSSHHHQHGHGHHHHHAKEITDHNRSQLGLSSRILQSSDYEGLLLSLQSPLPNEQDMAISVCTLLSNETKHVLHFSKSPAILNMLLAHAGIYQDCGMRVLMEETYRDARNLNHAEFWDEVLHHPDVRQLLCECYVKGVHSTLGLIDDEGAILSKLQEITDGNLPEEEKFALGTALRLKLARVRESRPLENTPSSSCSTPKKEPLSSSSAAQSPRPPSTAAGAASNCENEEAAASTTKDDETISDNKEMEVTTEEEAVKEENSSSEPSKTEAEGEKSTAPEPDTNNDSIISMEVSPEDDDANIGEVDIVKSESAFSFCCSSCVCQRTAGHSGIVDNEEREEEDRSSGNQFSIDKKLSLMPKTMVEDRHSGSVTSLLFTKEAREKVGQRIYQIAHILRNLSFEHDNALVMAQSPTLMRFLILSANCSFGSLAQASFDIIGNIASHIQLEEPLQNPLSSMLLTLVTSGIFSEDRFKILRSLEALRELTKCDGNEGIITRYIEYRVYERICDLLTLSDIMLLIYTLECILSMTGLGEAVCDEIVRVQGSVATLVSLVTVEAQSYGPKGCIQMRVVETVTGAAQQHAPASSTQTTASASSSSSSNNPSASLSTLPPTPQQQQPPQHQQPQVIHVPATQHLLQQQLQQPPNPIYASPQVIPSRPSPSNSPGIKIVSGTTTIVPPVVQGQHGLVQQSQQLQKPGVLLQNPSNGQVFTTPATPPPPSTVNNNHLNSSTQQFLSQQTIPVHAAAAAAVVQKPSVLPSSNISHAIIKTTTAIGTSSNSNGSIAACVPQAVQPPPPPGATMVIQQQPKPVITNAVGAAASALNGATTLVTGSVPQISNHNLSQHTHVVTPSISLVTPRGTLSEEAWAIAWLKGTFESSSGTSIEQGEIYRMYSAARKNPNLVLSLEQFVQCVKCAYGGNVGPVIKQFGGGTSLSFFEGIKPKISIRAVAVQPQAHNMQTSLKVVGHGANAIVNVAASVPATNTIIQPVSSGAVPNPPPAVVVPPQAQVSIPLQQATVPPQVPVTPKQDEVVEIGKMDQIPINNNNNDNGTSNIVSTTPQQAPTGATLPVSVHIPSREAKPSLSPILQATLSQPPKTKNNNNANATGSKRAKNQKGKEKQPSKKRAPTTTKSPEILCQKFSASPSSLSVEGLSSKGNTVLSPASSAIRSLLASKVAQRQQNKLQQQLPKNAKGKLNDKIISNTNAISKDESITPEIVKVNGVGPDGLLDKAEESSASSSVLSSDGSDNVASTKSSITSFHGVLHNGQASLDPKNELNLEGIDDPESLKNRSPMKGMLIDLLERRVPREPVNGVMTGREIRISEKGLELIDKMEETLGGPALLNHSSSTCTTNDAPESQKMTFYSSTSDAQVTLQGQASSTACVIPASVVGGPVLSTSSVTLASGVSGTPPVPSNILKGGGSGGGLIAGQQVKLCGGNIVEVIEQTVGIPTTIAADATVPAMETPAVIAEVEVESTDAPIAPAFSLGDGLATSATAATNGGVTYVVSDSTQSSAVLVDVDSVIAATAHSAPLVVDGNVVVVDGGEAMIVEDGDGNPVICNSFVDGGDASSSSVRPTESNISNGGGGGNNNGGGDLLEKFSQFSDLIVVPPEQLASLKRPSSPMQNEENSNPNNSSSDLPPPAKKQAVDSSLVEVTTDIATSLPSGTPSPAPLPVPVVASAGPVSTIIPPSAIGANNGSTPNVVVASQTASNAVGSATVVTTTTPSLPPGAGAQVVQLPLRLSVNPQNPQQLTFTRQLVLPSGQQVLLSTANSQSSLQGQVIISKTQGSTSDPMPKAIIILQQQQQSTGNVQPTPVPQQQTPTVMKTVSMQQPAVAPPVGNAIVQQQQQPGINSQQMMAVQAPMTTSASVPPPKPQIVAVQQHPVQRLGAPGTTVAGVPSPVQAAPQPVMHQIIHQKPALHQKQPPVMIPQQIPNLPQPHAPIQKPVNFIQFEGIKASSYPHLTPEQLDLEFPFMCEWAGCGLRFLRPQQVSMHALKTHCPEAMVDAVRCEWGQNGCDPLLRKRFSLMTHLQDRHCSKQALELALYRRKNRIDPPPIPQQPLHHPGYAPNAAFHAIKRHAMAFMSTKEHLHDDNEGPVTKSIRLTSALILRNLVNYSALGRRILRGYESHLSGIAMSNVESSRTIAQLLHDMNERPKSSK